MRIALKYVALSLHTCMYSICMWVSCKHMYDIWAFNTTRNTIILAIRCYVSLPLKKVHHRAIEFAWLWKFYMH